MGVNGIYGLGSGVDVESLVTQSMKPKQDQYDSLSKQKTKAEWIKDAYNKWYKQLSDFQNKTLYNYALSGTMAPKTVSSSDNKTVAATAGGVAANITHRVSVTGLSSNASLQSVGSIKGMGTGKNDSILLSDHIGISNMKMTTDANNPDNDKLTFTYGGHDYELIGSDIDKVAMSFTVKDGTTNTNVDTGTTVDTSHQVQFTFRDLVDSTYNDLASRISTGTNLTANYDSVNDSFNIYNKQSGSQNKIDIKVDALDDSYSLTSIDGQGTFVSKESTAGILNSLNLHTYGVDGIAVDKNGLSEDTVKFSVDGAKLNGTGNVLDLKGKNGSVIVDGKSYTASSNKIVIDGVSYSLNNLSKKDTATGEYETTTVTVSTDTDAIVKNVKQFVDDYNKLLQDLKDAVNTKPDNNYMPLTDSEKKSMSAEQITKWEDKAKRGLLYNDNVLTQYISDLRSAVGSQVDGINSSYNNLNNIGVSASADYTENKSGFLSLDEDKLRKTLAADPDAVYKIFNNPDADKNNEYSHGIIKKLNNVTTTAIGTGTIDKAGGVRGMAGVDDSTNVSDQSYWAKKILNWQDKMKNFKTQMDKYQDRLYSQFDQMESAIAKLNTQSNYLASFLG